MTQGWGLVPEEVIFTGRTVEHGNDVRAVLSPMRRAKNGSAAGIRASFGSRACSQVNSNNENVARKIQTGSFVCLV